MLKSKESTPAALQQEPELLPEKKFKVSELEVVRRLGQGVFGHVELVRDQLRNLYALKVIEKKRVKGKQKVRHVFDERDVSRRMGTEGGPFFAKFFESM